MTSKKAVISAANRTNTSGAISAALQKHIWSRLSRSPHRTLQIVSDWFHADLRGEIIRRAELHISETLFRNMEMLSAQGFLLRLDGRPAAVAAGIPLSDTVYDFCLLKQSTGEKGLGTLMYHTLMQQLRGSYQYLNAEEDMGIPGLWQKKTEMHPSGLIHIWEAVYMPA